MLICLSILFIIFIILIGILIFVILKKKSNRDNFKTYPLEADENVYQDQDQELAKVFKNIN
jgi:hypothetical protein